MIVSEQLRAARAMIGWTQEELAQRSGVPAPTIKRHEGYNGPLKAKWDTVIKLTKALEEIVSFDDNEARPGVWLEPKRGNS